MYTPATSSRSDDVLLPSRLRRAYAPSVVIKGTVRDGRIVVDEPTDLPEGTVLHLVLDDGADAMQQQEIDAINASIARSLEQARAGMLIPADDVIHQLRDLHKPT
jgi:hypothetical protein